MLQSQFLNLNSRIKLENHRSVQQKKSVFAALNGQKAKAPVLSLVKRITQTEGNKAETFFQIHKSDKRVNVPLLRERGNKVQKEAKVISIEDS